MVVLSRRILMIGAASAAMLSRTKVTAAATPAPFPVDPSGRLVSQDLAAYEQGIMSGGPGKDGIPAINKPVFWSAKEANSYLQEGDIVFGLVENETARAYPQRILVWHEIINDVVEGNGLAITYCPLTGTVIAFERSATEFGVSGRLVNSNLVMYDRDTDTWFPQVLAVGIRGAHKGAALRERLLLWTTWGRWRAAYPSSQVLSTNTGFARNYQRDPYGGYNPPSGYYRPDSARLFPVMNEDTRFPAKSMFLCARTDRVAVAFRLDTLRKTGHLVLETKSEPFTALYDQALDTGYIFRGITNGKPVVRGAGPAASTGVEGETLHPLNSFQAMWFAWFAFYPQTAVHE